MKDIIEEKLVKKITYKADDGRYFDNQKKCEEYEHFILFLKDYSVQNTEATALQAAYYKFFKRKESLFLDQDLFCVRYNEKQKEDFIKSISSYVAFKIEEFVHFKEAPLKGVIEEIVRSYEFKDNDLVLVYFYYESDPENVGQHYEVELYNKEMFLHKLKIRKDEIAYTIKDIEATVK